MKTSKELLEDLKKIEKTTISFDLPVLERIKLECLSFNPDEAIESVNGKEVVVGEFSYPLGVTNVYHHLSIGRELYRLIRSNPVFGDVIDKKKLSVRLISIEVARLAQFYMDQAYLKAKELGRGFDALKFHRIPDAEVAFKILVEAIMFIKVEKPMDKIEVFAYNDEIVALRKEIHLAEEKEKADKKVAEDKMKAKKEATKPEAKTGSPAPVKPDRTDAKYSGLLGDVEYEADLADYNKKYAEWSVKTQPIAEEDCDGDCEVEVNDNGDGDCEVEVNDNGDGEIDEEEDESDANE